MGDGWETARKAGRPPILKLDSGGLLDVPGSDWAILKLGHPGHICEIDIDTLHFKGNFPESCLVEGCFFSGEDEQQVMKLAEWVPIVRRAKVTADSHHMFNQENGTLETVSGPINYLRLTIYPDGGVSRLRAYGTLSN